MRCALNAMASSTALMIFSRIYLGMTNVATIMTIGAEMNLVAKADFSDQKDISFAYQMLYTRNSLAKNADFCG